MPPSLLAPMGDMGQTPAEGYGPKINPKMGTPKGPKMDPKWAPKAPNINVHYQCPLSISIIHYPLSKMGPGPLGPWAQAMPEHVDIGGLWWPILDNGQWIMDMDNG